MNKINHQQSTRHLFTFTVVRLFTLLKALLVTTFCAAHSHAIRAQPLALQRAQPRGQSHERGGAVRMRRLLGGQGHVAARVGRAQSAQLGVVDLG